MKILIVNRHDIKLHRKMKLYVFALFCGFIYICRPTYISKDFQIHSYFIILDFFLFLPNNKYYVFPLKKSALFSIEVSCL